MFDNTTQNLIPHFILIYEGFDKCEYVGKIKRKPVNMKISNIITDTSSVQYWTIMMIHMPNAFFYCSLIQRNVAVDGHSVPFSTGCLSR